MSNNSLGEAVLDLTADNSGLEKDLDKSKKTVEGKVAQLEKVFNVIASSAILATIAKAYNQVVKAAEEALVTEAKVGAVIRATGNAAGYTVDQLSDMADEFSRLTGVDDELILNAEAVLLTFRKVGRDVFPEATQAALDMSAVMGQDLQSSIVQIGKALNDPIAGISALSRVGVTFTEEQKDMIKSFMAVNDVASAQQVILDELKSEFGGTAEEMEKASTGSDRLKVAFGNLQEELGRNLVPQQRTWNLLLADTLDLLAESAEKYNDYEDAQRLAIENYNVTHDQMILSRAQLNMHRDEIDRNTRSIMRWSEYGRIWEERLAAETTSVQGLDSALEELDFKNLLDLTISISNETLKFNEEQEKVRQKQAEIKAEIDTLIAQGWNPLSEKVQDLQTKYNDLGVEYDNNALKHQEATNKILFNLLMQKLSIDGITDAEFQMALKFGEMTGQIESGAAQQALAFNQVTDAVLAGKVKIEDTQKVLDIMSKGYTIDVAINMLNQESLSAIPTNNFRPTRREKGGPITANEWYLVGEKGPELFISDGAGDIVPNINASPRSIDTPALATGAVGVSGQSISVGDIYVDARGAKDPQAVGQAAGDAVLKKIRSMGGG